MFEKFNTLINIKTRKGNILVHKTETNSPIKAKKPGRGFIA